MRKEVRPAFDRGLYAGDRRVRVRLEPKLHDRNGEFILVTTCRAKLQSNDSAHCHNGHVSPWLKQSDIAPST